ncbi:MAG: helix-turn-helix transcriptional regulator [Clostridiales bacterium]|nr:helix-turn-helix transcriptional regulator [Clostridiales bacterium]
MSFADVAKYLREEQGLSQMQLAEKIGISAAGIGHLELGKREPSSPTLILYANYFGVSADYLLGLETEWGAKQFSSPAPIYSKAEQNIIADYRQLNPSCQKLVQDTIKTLLASSGAAQGNKKNIS